MKRKIKSLLKVAGIILLVPLLGLNNLVAEASNLQALPNTGEELAKTGIILGGIILVIFIIIVLLRRKKEEKEK